MRGKGGIPKSVSLQSGIHEVERNLAAQAAIDAKNKAGSSMSSQPTNPEESTSSMSANQDTSSSHVTDDVISSGVKTSHSDSELSGRKSSTSDSESETSKGASVKNSNEFQGKNAENSQRENKLEGQESKTMIESNEENSATNSYAKNTDAGKVCTGRSSTDQFTGTKQSDGTNTSVCDSQIAQIGKMDRPQSLPLGGSDGVFNAADEDLKVPVEERGVPSGSSTPNNLVDEFTETLNKIEGLMKDTDNLSRDLAAHGEWYSGSTSQVHAKISQGQVKSRSVSQESIEA